MKSYTLDVGDRVRLMAFETEVTKTKDLFIGLTISPDISKTTVIGQAVLEAICRYSNGTLFLLDIGYRRTALQRFIHIVGQSKDQDAILVIGREDGLTVPIIEKLGIQKEVSRLARKFELASDHPILRTLFEHEGTA